VSWKTGYDLEADFGERVSGWALPGCGFAPFPGWFRSFVPFQRFTWRHIFSILCILVHTRHHIRAMGMGIEGESVIFKENIMDLPPKLSFFNSYLRQLYNSEEDRKDSHLKSV
jgi:hypothetical protein